MAGADMGDDHEGYFAGAAALKAGGTGSTLNQFVRFMEVA
jgi:isocitrate lyase